MDKIVLPKELADFIYASAKGKDEFQKGFLIYERSGNEKLVIGDYGLDEKEDISKLNNYLKANKGKKCIKYFTQATELTEEQIKIMESINDGIYIIFTPASIISFPNHEIELAELSDDTLEKTLLFNKEIQD